MDKKVLAFDFGASSGRAIIGTLESDKIYLETIHRFPNKPEYISDSYYWNIVGLFQEIKAGLAKSRNYEIESVGIDTWGVDYGLLDENGKLMSQIFHYRDARNEMGLEKVLEIIPQKELYALTGIQLAALNTIFQLYAMKIEQPYILNNAKQLLLMPDLLNFLLSGVCNTDYSFASTTGLLDIKTGNWNWEIIEKLGLPKGIFGEISASGKTIGNISQRICKELNIPTSKVISVASHDTASAVVGIPSLEKNVAYISSGTWSLFGTEIDQPNNSHVAYKYNFTNEGGFGGKIRLLKNIMGTWLIQQSREFWNNQGHDFGYGELIELAQKEKAFQSFIDVDDKMFLAPGNIPERVQEYCKRTGQIVPESIGSIMQTIYNGLIMMYRRVFDNLKEITQIEYPALHIVGGGTQDKYLCQQTADACGVKVIAGPVEATAAGNVAVQMIVNGFIKDINSAREIILNSFEMDTYIPSSPVEAEMAYGRYKEILGL